MRIGWKTEEGARHTAAQASAASRKDCALEVLDRVLEVLEEKVIETGVLLLHAFELTPRDDSARVTVQTVQPLVAVLNRQQVVW